MGILHENICTFMIILVEVFLEREIFCFLCSETFPENPAVYEIMRTNMLEPDRSQMTIYYGACAFCMPHNQGYKHTHTHTNTHTHTHTPHM